jgi:hypothetical protein
MANLPYMLLGYINTLTLAPFTNRTTKHSATIKKDKEEKKNHFHVLKITIDFGGRFDVNFARTIPLLP